jgi:aminoglycoside phosphotransferase (APT) family kinase protein
VLHPDEIPVDAGTVARLIADQFPEWAGLPVRGFDSPGTSHWIFRLGDERCVRLPRRPGSIDEIAFEAQWLPQLAPVLPVRIPSPLGLGQPGEGFAAPWAVYDWLPGEPLDPDHCAHAEAVGTDLAGFVQALWATTPSDFPSPGERTSGRGGPLQPRDAMFQAALAHCEGLIDVGAVAETWARLLAAPPWDEPPVLVHGDLMAGNLLVDDGRLSGVIDFGCLVAGDPATDLLGAWAMGPAGRAALRDALEVDDATWARGAGWALSVGVIALPYYLRTNPGMSRQNHHLIAQVLADA